MGAIDIDGDGTLDFSEFLVVMNNNIENSDTESELVQQLRVFDRDGSGLI